MKEPLRHTDCTAADLVTAAKNVCPLWSDGPGKLLRSMTFDAIRIVDGVADVVEEKCVACGALRQGLSS